MTRSAPAQSGVIELKALQGQVKNLVEDLRGQVAVAGELLSSLREEYAGAKRAGRVGASFESWLEDVLDQAAVAWVLGCVFVRFCEDNSLVEKLWVGGPEPAAPVERAVQNRQAYLIANPTHNDRHWLRTAFSYLAEMRATGKLFDEHNPLWRFDISGEAAEALSHFFRRGPGLVSLYSAELETRFLGDLYQDLSRARAEVRMRCFRPPTSLRSSSSTARFEPAVREFGLANTSVIDPTCGSGHFLLGAFHRLVRMWKDREPDTDVRELAQRALGQVHRCGHQPVRGGDRPVPVDGCGTEGVWALVSGARTKVPAASSDRRLAAGMGLEVEPPGRSRGAGRGRARHSPTRPKTVTCSRTI